MRALILGGARHGEWLDGLFDGTRVWVDLRYATTHVIRTLHSAVTDAATGEVTESYLLHVAVHPDLVGPGEPQVVGQLLNAIAMNAFARQHGEAEEIVKESPIEVPTDHRPPSIN